jgi:peptidoglycan-associated lipoprotein
VHFELDRYDLSPEAEATLQKQAALLQLYPQVVITIEGHADERGTREYNLALGERRATAVRNYLAALGVSPDRVSVISYGKERPACPEASEGCWSQNRRGVTVASQ